MLRGLLTAEALRTAMREFGNKPLTGVQMQWGLEHLTLTAASLKALGAEACFPRSHSPVATMREAEA